MQLTIPDCCLGEFCPGIHVEGHRMREDGTYYANDDHKKNAYHYHNTDGSVFYRYPDGSEYYRRKNGNITFRPPEDLAESAEGVDPTATPAPADADRARRPWCDWPPQLNLTVKTDGSSVFIRDNSGSAVTFEPVGSGAKVDLAPVYDRSASLGCTPLANGGSQASQCPGFGVQDWVRRQALVDIASRGQD